jgi:AraC-like DNA-binding protein
MNDCEVNIFETFQQSFHVPLTFSEFVISSMIKGKKVMHLPGQPSFVYLPGETVILEANQTMHIDFPEAELGNPTQCLALAVDSRYVNKTIQYLNTFYNSANDEPANWKLHFSQYHFSNDNEISDLINKIIRLSTSIDTGKDIYVDLNLKELLIRLIQTQRLTQTVVESIGLNNNTSSRLHFVLNYIHQNLTTKISVDSLCRKAYLSRNMFFKWFREQSGLSPLEYINQERVKRSKQLLSDARNSVQAAAMYSGFNDVNYFIRVFKKVEGVTPKAYQVAVMADPNRPVVEYNGNGHTTLNMHGLS